MGSGSFTFSKSTMVFRLASDSFKPLWCWMAPITRSSQVRTGFNEVMSSWKTIAILFPLILSNFFGETCYKSIISSTALNKISLVLYTSCGEVNTWRMVREETDLPEPDSPKLANISLRLTGMLILFNVLMGQLSFEKLTDRFLICKSWSAIGKNNREILNCLDFRMGYEDFLIHERLIKIKWWWNW